MDGSKKADGYGRSARLTRKTGRKRHQNRMNRLPFSTQRCVPGKFRLAAAARQVDRSILSSNQTSDRTGAQSELVNFGQSSSETCISTQTTLSSTNVSGYRSFQCSVSCYGCIVSCNQFLVSSAQAISDQLNGSGLIQNCSVQLVYSTSFSCGRRTGVCLDCGQFVVVSRGCSQCRVEISGCQFSNQSVNGSGVSFFISNQSGFRACYSFDQTQTWNLTWQSTASDSFQSSVNRSRSTVYTNQNSRATSWSVISTNSVQAPPTLKRPFLKALETFKMSFKRFSYGCPTCRPKNQAQSTVLNERLLG